MGAMEADKGWLEIAFVHEEDIIHNNFWTVFVSVSVSVLVISLFYATGLCRVRVIS